MLSLWRCEAARRDLYNGLVEVLGAPRADTLMAYLPAYDPSELATKSDLAATESRLTEQIDGLEGRIDRVEVHLSRVDEGLAAVNQRLDTLFHTLLIGMFGVLAAVAAAFFAGALL